MPRHENSECPSGSCGPANASNSSSCSLRSHSVLAAFEIIRAASSTSASVVYLPTLQAKRPEGKLAVHPEGLDHRADESLVGMVC